MHLFEVALEASRWRYGFYVIGYVVMPEHVHLLITEPERGRLARAVQPRGPQRAPILRSLGWRS